MSRPATDKQRDFIRKLVAERDMSPMPDTQIAFLSVDSNIDRLNIDQAKNAIKILLECDNKPKPKITAQQDDEPEVQAGYFFIIDPTDDKEKFFRVNHGKEGSKWEGRQFVSVQASDFFYPVKDKTHRLVILRQIALDPVSAMNEYGMRLGRCGVCNRTLTDRDSRLRGIGPICAARLNQVSEEDNTILRQLGLMG